MAVVTGAAAAAAAAWLRPPPPPASPTATVPSELSPGNWRLVATHPGDAGCFTQAFEFLDDGRMLRACGLYSESRVEIFELPPEKPAAQPSAAEPLAADAAHLAAVASPPPASPPPTPPPPAPVLWSVAAVSDLVGEHALEWGNAAVSGGSPAGGSVPADEEAVRLTTAQPAAAAAPRPAAEPPASPPLAAAKSSPAQSALPAATPLLSFQLPPSHFAEGSVLYKNTVLVSTWRERTLHVLDRRTLRPLRTLRWPFAEAWGLAADPAAKALFATTGDAHIHRLRVEEDPAGAPARLAPAARVTVRDFRGRPVPRLNELERLPDGTLLANVWFDARVFRVDPARGTVLNTWDLADLVRRQGPHADVLNGIAVKPALGAAPGAAAGAGSVAAAGRKITAYVTGKLWAEIYCVEFEL